MLIKIIGEGWYQHEDEVVDLIWFSPTTPFRQLTDGHPALPDVQAGLEEKGGENSVL